MGHKDLVILYEIYQECKRLEEQYNWGFKIKWDQGSFETRIDISESGDTLVGNGSKPLPNYEMFCPDLLLEMKGSPVAVIEYEEEARPNTGYLHAKKHKGHFEGNKRDTERDLYYSIAKLFLFKIWESDKEWKSKLKNFMLNVYIKTNVETNYFYKALKQVSKK